MAKVESIKSDQETSDNLTQILKNSKQDKKDWLKKTVNNGKNYQQLTNSMRGEKNDFQIVQIPLFHYRQLLEISNPAKIAAGIFQKMSNKDNCNSFEGYFSNLEDFQAVNNNVINSIKTSNIQDKTITAEHEICKNFSLMICEYLKLVCLQTKHWKINEEIASDRFVAIVLKQDKARHNKTKKITDR